MKSMYVYIYIYICTRICVCIQRYKISSEVFNVILSLRYTNYMHHDRYSMSVCLHGWWIAMPRPFEIDFSANILFDQMGGSGVDTV